LFIFYFKFIYVSFQLCGQLNAHCMLQAYLDACRLSRDLYPIEGSWYAAKRSGNVHWSANSWTLSNM